MDKSALITTGGSGIRKAGNETDDATFGSYGQSTWNSSNLSESSTNRFSRPRLS
jgi:hypothetical protein